MYKSPGCRSRRTTAWRSGRDAPCSAPSCRCAQRTRVADDRRAAGPTGPRFARSRRSAAATRRSDGSRPAGCRRPIRSTPKGYRRAFDTLDAWARDVDGLLTFGRQGLFAHDNTHHALAMAYAASRCLSDDGMLDRSAWAACRRAVRVACRGGLNRCDVRHSAVAVCSRRSSPPPAVLRAIGLNDGLWFDEISRWC